MGKGFNNYMCKKPFHPGSKDNIKRAWMAEQRTENEKRKQDELKLQYDKEQDLYNNRSLVSKESKEKLALNFMYEAPPGAKREHQKEDDEPEYKFEWQRKYNAPREDFAKDNKEIRDQPFGISVRNVRCIKCHQWGHINTDRECPQFNQAGTSSGGVSMDPLELMKQMRDDGLQLKQSVLGHRFNTKQTNQIMIGSDEEQEGDPEVEFLKSLTSRQKKKLLLKLNKMAKKQDPKADKKKRSKNKRKSKKKRKHRSKKASSSSDSSDADTAKKEKSHKKKKRSSRRKHRSSRKDSSADSSQSSSSSDESSSSSSSSSSGSDTERRRKRKHSEERTAAAVVPPSDVPSSKKAKRSHKKKDSKKDKRSREGSERRSPSSDSDNSSAGERHHSKKKRKHKSRERKHKSKSLSKEKTAPKAGPLFGETSKNLLPPGEDDLEDGGKFPKISLKPKKIIDFDFEKSIAKDNDVNFEDERQSLPLSHDTSDDGSKLSIPKSTGKPKKIIDFDFDAVSAKVGPLIGDPMKNLLQGEGAELGKSPLPSKKNSKPPKIIDFDFDALEQQGLGNSKPMGSKPEKIIEFDIDLEELDASHGVGSKEKYSPSSPTTRKASESSPDMQPERKLKFQDQGSFLRNPSPPSKGARSMSPPPFSP